MVFKSALAVALIAESAMAFPFVARMPGVNSDLLPVRSVTMRRRQGQTVNDCPFNPSYAPAAPITAQYPYLGAKNGLPGTGKGGILVPAKGDTAHYFQAPAANDVRGPCPGLNTLANHGFIARSGIVTYDELVDAQQNVYNVGYDLANLLAVAGVGLDGDLVGTMKLSIGCSDNARTATAGNALADELGLDGHNRFEADTSLTRDDYFLGNGNDYTWNATLFTEMMKYCNGNCSLVQLGNYRYQRYQESLAENPNFFFGPGSLLLYGAASFLYELFPTNGGYADPATMESFFGATTNSKGQYVWNGGERIPPNWFNRVTPFTNMLAGQQIMDMYLEHPVLFGGNIGVNNFDGMNFTSQIQNGKFSPSTAADVMCLLYQALTAGFPTEVDQILNLGTAVDNAIAAKLAPLAKNFGCPIDVTGT